MSYASNKQQIDSYYDRIARQYKKARELMGDCPECEFCGKDVITNERAEEIAQEAGRFPEYCTGIQYMQIDPFASEIHGDDSEYLMCDGQAYESAMDI